MTNSGQAAGNSMILVQTKHFSYMVVVFKKILLLCNSLLKEPGKHENANGVYEY